MLSQVARYAAEKAQEKYELGQRFELEDLFNRQDWNYLTDEGRAQLSREFQERIRRSLDGIAILDQRTKEGQPIYQKLADKVVNTNYFANKIY